MNGKTNASAATLPNYDLAIDPQKYDITLEFDCSRMRSGTTLRFIGADEAEEPIYPLSKSARIDGGSTGGGGSGSGGSTPPDSGGIIEFPLSEVSFMLIFSSDIWTLSVDVDGTLEPLETLPRTNIDGASYVSVGLLPQWLIPTGPGGQYKVILYPECK